MNYWINAICYNNCCYNKWEAASFELLDYFLDSIMKLIRDLMYWIGREGRGSNPLGTHIFLLNFIHIDKEKVISHPVG